MGEPDVVTSRWGVALDGDAFSSGQLQSSEFEQAISSSSLVELAANPTSADLRIEARANSVFRFYLANQANALAAFRIPTKRARSLPRKVQGIAEHLSVYHKLLELQAPLSYIADAIDLQFVRLLEPASLGKTPAAEPLATDESGNYMMKAGQNLAVVFSHNAPDPLYFYVLAMDGRTQSAAIVYPYKPEFSARVKPGESVMVGAGPVYLIELQVPDGYPSGIDIFKIFVSSAAIEHPEIKLPRLGTLRDELSDLYGTGVCLDRELRKVLTGRQGTAAMPSFEREPWWTMQKTVLIEST
ncbi:MAG: hypothetical protein AAGB13_06445 [Cyanobacteria bacterium P01_F01_bin.33]